MNAIVISLASSDPITVTPSTGGTIDIGTGSSEPITVIPVPAASIEIEGVAVLPGPPGPQGDAGPQGPTGLTGPKGDTGAQGPTGLTGAAGAAGATGSKGDRGDPGPKGETGAQGVKGDIGDMGPQGPIGLTGAAGAKGDTGDTGPQGPTNPAAVTGPATSTDRALARYDGTTGKLLIDSKLTVTDAGLMKTTVDAGTSGNLLDVQLNGSTYFGMSAAGRATLRSPGPIVYLDWFGNDRSGTVALNGGLMQLNGSYQSTLNSAPGSSRFAATNSNGTVSYFGLYEEGVANILALRNGASAQVFRAYNTWGLGVNYERAVFDWQTVPNVLLIGAEAGGTGTLRGIRFTGASFTFGASGAPATFKGTVNLNPGVASVTWLNSGGIRTGDGTSSSFIVINTGSIGDNTLYLNLDNPTAPVAASNMLINVAGAPAQRALSQVNPMNAGLNGSYTLSNWRGLATPYKVPSAAFCSVSNGGNTPTEYLPVAVWGRDGKGGESYNNIVEWKLGRYTGAPTDTSAATAMTLAMLQSAGGNTAADIMTWEARGRVGINTNAPAEALDVAGKIRGDALILKSPAGTRYTLGVADDGSVTGVTAGFDTNFVLDGGNF